MSRATRVAVGCIGMTMLCIGAYSTLSVYLVPLTQALNIGMGEVAFIFTFSSIGGLLTSAFLGQILKRVRAKLLVCLAGIAFAVFFITLYLAVTVVQSIVIVYVGGVFLGYASAASGMALSQIEISWWYVKGTGKIMSLPAVFYGLFAFLTAPLIAIMITNLGVATSALLEGLVLGALIFVIGITLISEHPDKYGLKPVGYEEQQKTAAAKADSGATPALQGLSMKQIVKTPQFIMIMGAQFFICLAATGVSNNGAPFFQSLGADPMNAAFCVSIFNLSMVAWSFIFGTVSDKFGPGISTLVFGIIGAGGLLLGIFVNGFVGAAIVAGLLGSFTCSGLVGALSALKVFGPKESGSIIGYIRALSNAGTMLGAPIAGFIFAASGSYFGFIIAGSIFVVLTIIFILAATSKNSLAKIKAKELQSSLRS